jgi:hypothetical protein
VSEQLPQPNPNRFPGRLTAGQVRSVPAGTQIGRVYATAGKFPVQWGTLRTFGPMSGRFDHQLPPPHDQPDRAVLYGAIRGLRDRPAASTSVAGSAGRPPLLFTCMCEVFQDRGVIELSRDGVTFAVFRTTRVVRLLKVSDSDWVTRAGGNAALTSGPRGRAQEWARAIYDRYPRLDGLVYASSTLPPGRCVVLTERATDALPQRPTINLPLADPTLRPELETYATRLGRPLLL